jgi:hypothetical protein
MSPSKSGNWRRRSGKPAPPPPSCCPAGTCSTRSNLRASGWPFNYDPYFAVFLSGVRALPHQLEAVYEELLPQPRLRFVLAHDPGAGKTIMAGLLIKELKLRGAADRILIIVPASLTPQWQDELSEKFQETFEIIDSHSETGQVAGNIWQRFSQVITSMDYAKRDANDNPEAPPARSTTRSCSALGTSSSWMKPIRPRSSATRSRPPSAIVSSRSCPGRRMFTTCSC